MSRLVRASDAHLYRCPFRPNGCEAQRCMAWRWHGTKDEVNVSEVPADERDAVLAAVKSHDRHDRDFSISGDTLTGWPTKGFCGIAGRP